MASQEPGGFMPTHVLTPPRSSRTASSAGGSILPQPRRTPLKVGSTKEWTLIDYLDKHITTIQRRYAKRGTTRHNLEAIGGGPTMAGVAQDISNESDFSEQDLKGVRGYESFREAGADIEKLLDIVWVSGTPTLQISYLLNLALLVLTYIPSFPPAPRTLFRILSKLDTAFASLIMGRDLDSGVPLPGFSTDDGAFGRMGGGVTPTEKVRIKSLIERTRVVVVEVMNAGEFEIEEDDDEGDVGENADPLAEARGDDVDYSDYNMDVARVYDKTLVELGDSLVGPQIGIVQDSSGPSSTSRGL